MGRGRGSGEGGGGRGEGGAAGGGGAVRGDVGEEGRLNGHYKDFLSEY